MKQPLCNRADLLRALMSERSESASFVARDLGFARRIERRQTPDGLSPASPGQGNVLATIALDEGAQEFPDIPFWRVEACQFYDDFEDEDITAPKSGKSQPSWEMATEHASPVLAHWRDIEPRMRWDLASSASTGRIDLGKTITRLSRAEILHSLPRRRRRSWGSEVQVIVDRSTAMTPYWQDQVTLCAELERLFPRDAVHYADYREGYREPVMSGEHGGKCGYRLPAAGSVVIVLGDLGLLASADERTKWRRLGQHLRQHQCRALALVPTEARLATSGLQRYWRVIPWERGVASRIDSTVLDGQVKRLLVLISPATRIDRGFLRQIRRLIGADAAAEAAVWRHPALVGKSSVAATLDPKRLHELRARFEDENEVTRKAVLTLLRQWRIHLPPEIWYEEIVSLKSASQRLLPRPDEVDHAYTFFKDAGQRVYDGNEIRGLSKWFRDVEQRLPDGVWHNPKLKTALHRVWAYAHRHEPDAEPPPGYEPRFSRQPADRPVRCYQLYQSEDQLHIIEAPPLAGQASEAGRGSWLGQLISRSGEIALLPLESKRDDFWLSGQAPAWSSDWGEDEYGRWVEFSLDYDGVAVMQRMRWIAPGTFLMGSPEDEMERWDEEGPQHEVTLTEGYWLFDTTVTQALWRLVMNHNPSRFQDPERPVENVSWHDCHEFIEKLDALNPELGLTLPSEAQWEYACRAGSRTPFTFGHRITPELANYNGNYPYAGDERGLYRTQTVAAKSFLPNAWGLYQMHGNVDEWCLDGKRDYGFESVMDPLGPTEEGVGRVVRGGSWSDDARVVRAAFRVVVRPGSRAGPVGIRCARVGAGAEPVEPWRRWSGTRRPATDRAGGARRVVLSHGAGSVQLPWPKRTDFALRSDSSELIFRQLNKPQWAPIIGRDRFGLWACIELEGKNDPIRQRLRWIPPGRFMMGSPEREHGGLAKEDYESGWFAAEGPQHPVIISRGFWLFDTPVTQALWELVMGSNPSEFKSPRRPVESVSWKDADEFIQTLNGRIPGLKLTLPTEAQWEYACRANVETSTYNGELEIVGESNGPLLDEIAWYGGNSGVNFDLEDGHDTSTWQEKQYTHTRAGTREVALKRPNGWGFHDMLGNVWEWCRDGQRTYDDKEEMDPLGSLDEGARRVVRGGSWCDRARRVRAAYRRADAPGSRSFNFGFRCARVQESAGAEPSSRQGSARERRPVRGEAE